MSTLLTGARLALGTLTIIPVGDLGELDRRHGRLAMLLAPLAALPLGGAVALLLWGCHALHTPALVGGLLAVGMLAYGTRAMHVDGLADTVDGFGAGWTRERAVAVMKSGDIGPMGVLAVLVAAGLQAVCFSALEPAPLTGGAAVVVSRVACTVLASTPWRAARPDGLGALVAGTVGRVGALVAVVLCAVALVGAGVVDGLGVWRPVGGMVAAGVALVWLGRRATRVLGGISGDIFGAGVEMTLTVLLIALTLGGPS